METNRIYKMDCLEFMRSLPDESLDLIVTSPPYNKNAHARGGEKIGNYLNGRKIAYDVYTDDMPQDQYEEWQRDVIREGLRVLKPTGSMYYNHKDIQVGGSIIHPKWVYDFDVHQLIVWDRSGTNALDPHYFFPITEYIFWLVKDPKRMYFDRDKTSNKSNVWRFNVERNPHPAPFPLALASRCILTSCPPEGLVYDPFMGSGTTAVATLRAGEGRTFLGTEISEDYISMANNRIKIENSQLSLF